MANLNYDVTNISKRFHSIEGGVNIVANADEIYDVNLEAKQEAINALVKDRLEDAEQQLENNIPYTISYENLHVNIPCDAYGNYSGDENYIETIVRLYHGNLVENLRELDGITITGSTTIFEANTSSNGEYANIIMMLNSREVISNLDDVTEINFTLTGVSETTVSGKVFFNKVKQGKSAFEEWKDLLPTERANASPAEFILDLKNVDGVYGPKYAPDSASAVIDADGSTVVYFIPHTGDNTKYDIVLVENGVANALATEISGDITNYSGIYDVSADHNDVPYSSISDAIGDIPLTAQRGGMTIKFKNSNDDYEQWLLTDVNFTTDESKWIKVNSVKEVYDEVFGVSPSKTTVGEKRDWVIKSADNKFTASSGATSFLIPVIQSDVVTIKANSGRTAYYAVLKSMPANGSTGVATGYYAEGVSGLITISGGTTVAIGFSSYTGQETYYLYVSYIQNNYVVLSSIKKNDIILDVDDTTGNLVVSADDGIPSLEQRLKDYTDTKISEIPPQDTSEIEAGISELQKEINGGVQENKVQGWINKTRDEFQQTDEHECYFWDIEDNIGQNISIKGNKTAKSRYSLLTAMPDISKASVAVTWVDGQADSYVDFTANTTTTITVPEDAKVLYIEGGSFLPQSLKINGVEKIAVESIPNKVTTLENKVGIIEPKLLNVVLPNTITATTANGFSYYTVNAAGDATIKVGRINCPLKISMLCRVTDAPLKMTMKHSYFGSSSVKIYTTGGSWSDVTYGLYGYAGFWIDNIHWELKEFILPIPVFSGTITLGLPEGLMFDDFRVSIVESIDKTPMSKMFHAHLGIQFGRNALMSFTAAAKYGFSYCISNVRKIKRYSDPENDETILVCIHDHLYTNGNDVENLNIYETSYEAIESAGYKDKSSAYRGDYYEILGDNHLCTVDEFLSVCAKTNMIPEFSIQTVNTPNGYGVSAGDLYEALSKYGFENKCIIKCSDLTLPKNYHNLLKGKLAITEQGITVNVKQGVSYVYNKHFASISDTDIQNLALLTCADRVIVEYTHNVQGDSATSLPTKAKVQEFRDLGIEIGLFDNQGAGTRLYKEAMERGITYFTTDTMISVGVNF